MSAGDGGAVQRCETCREDLVAFGRARSSRWTVAVKDLSIRVMIGAEPIDMNEWDEATHRAVRAWAEGEGDVEAVPAVLADYLAGIRGAS